MSLCINILEVRRNCSLCGQVDIEVEPFTYKGEDLTLYIVIFHKKQLHYMLFCLLTDISTLLITAATENKVALTIVKKH